MASYRLDKAILLNIAEHASRDTISAMTRTNKDINDLIFKYEKSLSKAKLSNNFTLAPLGHILSSVTEDRTVIQTNTFEAVQEIELRDRRITSILNAGFLCTGNPKSLGLTPEALEKLKINLRRALYVTDRLADLAATSPADPPACCPYHVQQQLRKRQITMLSSLSDRDLAFLAQLTALAGMGYARYKGAELRSDPTAWDKVTAFQEMLLRQGSFLLWAYVRGGASMSRFMESCVHEGVIEINMWEMGSVRDMLPSLHMTMTGEFRKRRGCEIGNVGAEVDKLVAGVIGGAIVVAQEE